MAGGKPAARRVFISYTAEDLVRHADSVAAAARELEWIAVDHRDWEATGRRSVEECLERVRGCDILVVLVAWRYGWVPPATEPGADGRTSIVGLEVAEARRLGRVVLSFVVQPGSLWHLDKIEPLTEPNVLDRIRGFTAEQNETLRDTFTHDPESLRHKAYRALEAAGERLDDAAAPGAARPAAPDEPIRRYLAWLAARYEHVDLIGFGDRFRARLPIDDIYVSLRVSVAPGPKEPKDQPGRFDRADFVERDVVVEDAFRKAGERKLRGMVFRGDPGAGKTTVSLRVVRQCAQEGRGPASLGLPADIVPVFLRLRRITADDASIEAFMERQVAEHCEADDGFGRALWKRGRLLWVLDGLDEVADPTLRERTSRWIDEALRTRTKDHFLVTSRYAGWQDGAVLMPGFLVLDVQPLPDDKRDEFVRLWFRAVEVQALGATEAAHLTADEQSTALLRLFADPAVSRNQRLASMVARPIFLAILCVVFRTEKNLPRRRSTLYARCIDVLLESWRRDWREEVHAAQFDAAAAELVLQPLAWWLHGEVGRNEAATDDCVAAVDGAFCAVAGRDGVGPTAAALLERVRLESGLLVAPDPGRYAFLHQSFQEYLAGRHAKEQGLDAELAAHFGESWWEEILLLAVNMADQAFLRRFFERLVRERPIENEPDLFEQLLHEASSLPMEPFVGALEREETPPARVALLLRVLGDRRDESVLAATMRLVRCPHRSVADAAADALMRAGVAVPALSRQAVQVELVSRVGIALVTIPTGEFDMGSSDRDDERPIHRVRVRTYQLARHPVTNEEYGRFLKDNPEQRPPELWTNTRYNQPRQPVVGVSWADAQSYCQWAGLRLPTEAEWEYACRAGTKTEYWTGDAEADLARAGWYDENSEGRLHAVEETPPNVWGLYDTHGNVWEWCEDSWHSSHVGAPTDGTAWLDDASANRVLRGGSFLDPARRSRSAYRIRHPPTYRGANSGFRPARSVATT